MVASRVFGLFCAAVLLVGGPALAQAPQGDPYAPPSYSPPPPPPPPPPGYDVPAPSYQPVDPGYAPPTNSPGQPIPIEPAPVVPPEMPAAPPAPPAPPTAAAPTSAPFTCSPHAVSAQSSGKPGIPQDDVMSAAEGVFGKGAQGLAGVIERIFKDRGQPNAYIAGREAGGAFIVGLRYGAGTMCHRVEGDRKVYWTGPSIGFDVGADANKVFVLVYNLHDSQELFRRYPTAEGRAYFVGGFSASVLQLNDVILVPIRLGVGLRLGVNGGYMKFSEKSNWIPF